MVVLVACETLLLALLTLLVIGLLRSHAEILRRLGPPETGTSGSDAAGSDATLPEPGRRAGARPGQDVAGVTLNRDALQIGLDASAPPTLLAFLSSGCTVCARFWDDLRGEGLPPAVPPAVRLIAVTKDPSHESPSRLRELAPATVPVIMSSAAWRDYRVPGAPYFVYLERGRVHGEGSASSWTQIASLLRDAIDDVTSAAGGDRADVEETLAAAGIGPGHPSLYPGRQHAAGNLP
jgi:hypothetical protein